MPDNSSNSLPYTISHSFEDSLAAEYIHLYDYESTSQLALNSSSRAQHFLHVVPDLKHKPAVPLRTPDLSKLSKRDPFEGPDFGKGEKIVDLTADKTNGAPYALVHNLHALMKEHFMAVPHFDGSSFPFRPQTSPLTSSDLEIASLVVQSYRRANRNLVCFFNGGPSAGASQPHLHIQFCPFQHDEAPLPQQVADEMEIKWNEEKGVEEQEVVRLKLPWTVFCVALPPSSSNADDPSTLEKLYHLLMTHSNSYISHLSSTSTTTMNEIPSDTDSRNSHNLYLTSSHLFYFPRRSRMITIPRHHSLHQGRLSLGGGWEDVEGSEKSLRLSVNGLLGLGYWYVGSKEEEQDLREFGVERTLKECGYVNEEY